MVAVDSWNEMLDMPDGMDWRKLGFEVRINNDKHTTAENSPRKLRGYRIASRCLLGVYSSRFPLSCVHTVR